MTSQNIFFTSGLKIGDPLELDKLIAKCNDTLTKSSDVLYIVGNLLNCVASKPGIDLSTYRNVVTKFVNNLNSTILLLPGENDIKFCNYLEHYPIDKLHILSQIEVLKVYSSTIVLSYWPLVTWPKKGRGSKLLHGVIDLKTENTLNVNYKKHSDTLLHYNEVASLTEAKNVPF